MKKSESAFKVLFALIMFFCVLFLVWYIPAVHALTFRINDVRISLEMSQGRERKQQNEYDEAAASILETETELARLTPLCDTVREEVQALKEEKKRLKEEKKSLTEEKTPESEEKGGSGNE